MTGLGVVLGRTGQETFLVAAVPTLAGVAVTSGAEIFLSGKPGADGEVLEIFL